MKKYLTLIILLINLISKADYWTQKASFPAVGRSTPFFFAIGNNGYVGTGYFDNGTITVYKKDFWEFNSIANVWTQKADFGGIERRCGVGFSIGDKGYAGLGDDLNHNLLYDFWQYDTTTNVWTQKANFGGSPWYTTGFGIANKGYVCTGWTTNGISNIYSNQLWEYDALSDSWTQKDSLPGTPRCGAVAFSIGNKAYVGTGYHSNYLQDFWEYDLLTNSWTQKANTPVAPRTDAAGFSIGNFGYLGFGEVSGFGYMNDLWQYDPLLNQWTQKTSLPAAGRDEAVYFTIGNKGYIGLGMDTIAPYYGVDFWEYCPYNNCVTGINEQNEITNKKIYPNPFNDKLTFSNIDNARSEIILYDIASKKIMQRKFINSVSLNTEQLAKGIYIYELRDKNGLCKKGKVVKD